MDEGWTRFIFDSFNVPYSSVRDVEVKGENLNSKYDALILPSQKAAEIIEGNVTRILIVKEFDVCGSR